MKITEGLYFKLALPDKSSMTGVISRKWGSAIYCYFFDVAFDLSIDASAATVLKPSDALVSLETGALGFSRAPSIWMPHGILPLFSRSIWAPPPRYRIDPIGKKAYRVECEDHDPRRILREHQEPLKRGLATIGVMNYGGIPAYLCEARKIEWRAMPEWWEKIG